MVLNCHCQPFSNIVLFNINGPSAESAATTASFISHPYPVHHIYHNGCDPDSS